MGERGCLNLIEGDGFCGEKQMFLNKVGRKNRGFCGYGRSAENPE